MKCFLFRSFSIYIFFKAKTTMCNAAFLRLPLSDCQNGRRAIVYFLFTMFLFGASNFQLVNFLFNGLCMKKLMDISIYICRYIYPIYPIYPRQRRIQKNRNLQVYHSTHLFQSIFMQCIITTGPAEILNHAHSFSDTLFKNSSQKQN